MTPDADRQGDWSEVDRLADLARRFQVICRAWMAQKSALRKPERSMREVGRTEFGFTDAEAKPIIKRAVCTVRRGISSDLAVVRIVNREKQSGSPFKFKLRVLKAAAIVISAFIPLGALAGQATVRWDANTETDLAGYRLYYGTAPRIYGTVIPTSFPSVVVGNLSPGVAYFFAATAMNTAGFESQFSNEASFVLPTPTPTPTPTPPQPTPTVTPPPPPTPTPVSISGTVFYCAEPLPGVTLTLSGSWSSFTLSDLSGSYVFSPLVSGGSYTVAPSRTPLLPGSLGIDTVDVVAVQRHFLGVPIPPGCRLAAADVDGDNRIDTVDVIAIQRFVIGFSSAIANVGRYQFTPVNRSYPVLVTDQTGQDYDTILFGDCAGTQPRAAPVALFSF